MYIIISTDWIYFYWNLQPIIFEPIQPIKTPLGCIEFYNETTISRIKIMFSNFLRQPSSSLVSKLSVKKLILNKFLFIKTDFSLFYLFTFFSNLVSLKIEP